MNQSEIRAAIQAAFISCEISLCPLNPEQKQILLQIITESLTAKTVSSAQNYENPLDQLTPPQLETLIDYIHSQAQQGKSWKTQLLDDWLNSKDSGRVQFIRTEYGIEWINRIQPIHLKPYLEANDPQIKLKVGDRIEVCNGLWEWVQDGGPCGREWYPCEVISISQPEDSDASPSCIVRFTNGAEFEIQGIYDWNQYYWRFTP